MRMTWAMVAAAGILAGMWGEELCAQTQPADPLEMLEQAGQAENLPDPGDLQRQLNAGIRWRRVTDPSQVARLAAGLGEREVGAAMQRGADYLLNAFQQNGRFAPQQTINQTPWAYFAGDQGIGVVALAVQGLIETGRATGDPRLRPFSKEMTPLVNWLLDAHSTQTYSTALQAGALALLPARPEVKKALDRVRTQLVAGMREDGAYTYSLMQRGRTWDNSNTQYALLGVWAAAEAGAEVPVRFWEKADAHWRQTQAANGGWAYGPPAEGAAVPGQLAINTVSLPTLTVAGVASLYVTQEHLHGGRELASEATALTRGLAAVETDFRKHKELLGDDFYYAYGVQRVGVASGRKYLDGVNWLRQGAALMLLSQAKDGSWRYAYSQPVGTAYALLFLAHGGSPVIFNKLEYAGEWNANPRDDANVTRRIGKTLELPLNWQIVSAASDPGDWLDAPVLLVSGRGDPHFSPELLQKLKAYVHSGGIVFSMADDGDPAFTEAIRGYAAEVSGKRDELRTLPADHPLFTLYEPVRNPPGLLGISNGVRELWIHSPVDFGASWQTFAYSNKDHWTVPLNLYMYATGRKPPRPRLDALTVDPGSGDVRARLSLGRLMYDGNADPEPGAWPRMAKLMRRDAGVALDLKPVAIEKLDPGDTPVAHLTGTERLHFSDREQETLRHFLHNGGILIADAAGGSEAFTSSFMELAKSLAPEEVVDVLPLDDRLFNGTLPGSVKMTKETVEYRKSTPPSRRAGGKPEVWVWSIAGRPAIYFSAADITSGLLGTQTWGISGYAPETAEALARNLLLDILQEHPEPAATTAPATKP